MFSYLVFVQSWALRTSCTLVILFEFSSIIGCRLTMIFTLTLLNGDLCDSRGGSHVSVWVSGGSISVLKASEFEPQAGNGESVRYLYYAGWIKICSWSFPTKTCKKVMTSICSPNTKDMYQVIVWSHFTPSNSYISFVYLLILRNATARVNIPEITKVG